MNTNTNRDETARPALEPMLTIDDLEILLRVSRRTISRWCKSGVLPAPLKLGGSNRWRADEVTSALERKEGKGTPAESHQS